MKMAISRQFKKNNKELYSYIAMSLKTNKWPALIQSIKQEGTNTQTYSYCYFKVNFDDSIVCHTKEAILSLDLFPQAIELATIDPVAIGLAGQTEQKERAEFRERKVKGREQTQMWADWT